MGFGKIFENTKDDNSGHKEIGGSLLNIPMKITDIEAIPLRVPYEERIRKQYYHFAMIELVTVYKFYTDTDLIGLGENPGPPFDQEILDPYLGTNPFDHVMGEGRFNLDMACYDLMGKHLGLPAWKLMGQQVREWVAMGWWMPCMSPEDTAAEVQIAAERGYRGLKCKARAFYDVVEQSKAMQAVAPPDFRVEFDFNGSLINVEKALPILRELEKIPVVKGLEEPIFAYDLAGWRRLHQEIRIPFYLHGVGVIREGASRQPSGPWIGLRSGDFEGALCSHESVKSALHRGGLLLPRTHRSCYSMSALVSRQRLRVIWELSCRRRPCRVSRRVMLTRTT